MNCVFPRGEFVFGTPGARNEQLPTGSAEGRSWRLTDGSMTGPRRLPPIPEEELPSLTRTTPKIAKKKQHREKNPKETTPSMLSEDDTRGGGDHPSTASD